jgi:phospholipase D1/2
MAAVSLLCPGTNCQRVAPARRAALLIDAEAYFSAFARAALRARRSIVIVGWDFHSATRLHLGRPHVPDVLGDFLNFLVERSRTLEVYILTWDYPLVFARGRESAPVYKLGWHPHRRVHFRYDDRCPAGAALHQKIVVIDGAVAFCGGIDLTCARWDTSEHRACDARRRNDKESQCYPPYHDVMLTVDAGAARALHDLVSERWANASGQALPAPDPCADPWPVGVMPSFTDVDVGVARTVPPLEGAPPVAEIRHLYLDLIASARRSIYIENQYFTARELGEALARRLEEPNGPEVVVVLRHFESGLVEAPAMGAMRSALLRKLHAADRYSRFRAYYPGVPGLPAQQCCDLHSKLMIVDEQWLLVGSANFANRSMSIDTECNLLVQPRDERRNSRAIAACRDRLLGEHLDVPAGRVQRAIEEHGSMGAAVDALRRPSTRTLEPFEKLDEPSPTLVAVASVADPERAWQLESAPAEPMGLLAPTSGVSLIAIAAAVTTLAACLVLFWHYGPAAVLTDALPTVQLARSVAQERWVPLLIVAAYTPAAIVLFPRPLITLFAVVALGAGWGFACAFAGVMISAAVTFALGRRLDRSLVRRLAGRRLGQVSRFLYQRGTLAMAAVRLVPLAPFAVINVVAGAMGVRAGAFLAGTALGLLPGTLVATLFGDELRRGLHDPHSINVALCAAAVAALVTAGWLVRRWFVTARQRTANLPACGKGTGAHGRVAAAAR